MYQSVSHYIAIKCLIAEGIASRTTLWRWQKKGLRVYRVGGKRMVKVEDLNRFIEEQDALARGKEM